MLVAGFSSNKLTYSKSNVGFALGWTLFSGSPQIAPQNWLVFNSILNQLMHSVLKCKVCFNFKHFFKSQNTQTSGVTALPSTQPRCVQDYLSVGHINNLEIQVGHTKNLLLFVLNFSGTFKINVLD